MASLRDLRKRIKSVRNTQKITKAMKMVAAAKLRRAQNAVEATRPYAEKVQQTVSALAKRAEMLGEAPHPLLRQGLGGKPIEVVILTSDRGLCGGFNSNTVRRALRFALDERENHERILVSTIGRKGRDLVKDKIRDNTEIRTHHDGLLGDVEYQAVSDVVTGLCQRFVDGEIDGVFLVYNEFKGGLQVEQMLPVKSLEHEGELAEYEYEPSRERLLDELLPVHFSMELYRAVLETAAAEHLARMMAMDNATKNASEMADKLTLQYNRARQAAITTELIEIISGAEALK